MREAGNEDSHRDRDRDAARRVRGDGRAAGIIEEWTQPRTPDGQPDLQGIWTNYTSTPFEVPDESDRPDFYAGDVDGTGARHRSFSFLNDTSDRKLAKARSLVVDPPSGRVPIMPWAEEVRNFRLTHIQDDWVNFTPWERCITRGVPGGIFPGGLRLGIPDPPGPGYVAIVYEMIHEARMIPNRRAAASRFELPFVERRLERALGGQHARRRHHRLQRQGDRSRPTSPRSAFARSRRASSCTRSSASHASTRTRSITR
jgi:hypothetical protein